MSLFSKIGSWFKKVFGHAASWEKIASVTLTVAAPLTETIIGLTAGEPASAAVAKIISQIQNDMAAVSVTIESAGPTPTITSFLEAIDSNAKLLLTSGDIKDPATLAKVQEVVDVITGEIAAILAVLPAKS